MIIYFISLNCWVFDWNGGILFLFPGKCLGSVSLHSQHTSSGWQLVRAGVRNFTIGSDRLFRLRIILWPPAFSLIPSQPGVAWWPVWVEWPQTRSSGANCPQPPPGRGGVNSQSQTRSGNTNQTRVIPLESVNLSLSGPIAQDRVFLILCHNQVVSCCCNRDHPELCLEVSMFCIFFKIKSTSDYRWQKVLS